MRAITITQPWASAIMAGAKAIETRSWRIDYRGEMAIHASKRWNRDDREFAAHLWSLGLVPAPDELPLGAVLGTVELLACDPVELLITTAAIRDHPNEVMLGDYSPGRYGWILQVRDVFQDPVPAAGRLGVWNWTRG